MADLIRRRWEVEGRVQGVGFRAFVCRRAQTLGLEGWVRNTPRGTVEVAAQGPESEVGKLAADLRIGPRSAHVTAVTEVPLAAADALSRPFSILP